MSTKQLHIAGRNTDGSHAIQLAVGDLIGPRDIGAMLVAREAGVGESWSGSGGRLPERPAILPGYAVTARAGDAAIIVRVENILADGAIVGRVEGIDAPRPAREVAGVKHGDRVLIRDRRHVHHVATDR